MASIANETGTSVPAAHWTFEECLHEIVDSQALETEGRALLDRVVALRNKLEENMRACAERREHAYVRIREIAQTDPGQIAERRRPMPPAVEAKVAGLEDEVAAVLGRNGHHAVPASEAPYRISPRTLCGVVGCGDLPHNQDCCRNCEGHCLVKEWAAEHRA